MISSGHNNRNPQRSDEQEPDRYGADDPLRDDEGEDDEGRSDEGADDFLRIDEKHDRDEPGEEEKRERIIEQAVGDADGSVVAKTVGEPMPRICFRGNETAGRSGKDKDGF